MKFYLKPSSICSMKPSCSSVFLLVVEVATYQWATIQLWCVFLIIYTSQEYRRPPLCPVMSRQASHISQDYRHQHCIPSCPLEEITCHTHGGLHTYHSPSVNVSPYYSIHKMCYYIHIHHIITDALWDVLMSDWVNLSSVCLITHITILWKSPSV